MLCYKDRTYCCASNICGRFDCVYRITTEEQLRAARASLAIAWADFRNEQFCPGFVEKPPEESPHISRKAQ